MIITHEDGTTEENPAIIKSLGLSQEETDYFLKYQNIYNSIFVNFWRRDMKNITADRFIFFG